MKIGDLKSYKRIIFGNFNYIWAKIINNKFLKLVW